MSLTDIIRAVQKAVGVDVDGKPGPQTWQAIYNRVVPQAPTDGAPNPNANAGDTKVDDRSEETIATLLPEVGPYARALINKAAATGITIKAISGLRTYAEQDELYAQGRTKPGPIVTHARGGYSNHNFGVAFDIGVFEEDKWMPESPKYKAVGALGVDLGLEWGGNWTTIVDEPHYQLRPSWAGDMTESNMLAELRSRKDSGTGVYV